MVYYKDLTTNEVYGYDETEESQLPYIQKAINNGWENITGSYPLPPITSTAERNQQKASGLLYDTDWAAVSDIGNPSNNPHLINQSEFFAYRSIIRAIAIYPPVGDLAWPTIPKKVWSNQVDFVGKLD